MSSFDRLTEMVEEKNTPTYPLTRDSIRYVGVASDPSNQWNTRVTMQARPGSGYVGSVQLFYTRANLTALGTLEFSQEAPFTIAQLCEMINAEKASQMTAEDLSNTYIPQMETGVVTTLILGAAEDSLVWLGNTQVSLLTGIPAKAPDLSNFLNNVASGLFD